MIIGSKPLRAGTIASSAKAGRSSKEHLFDPEQEPGTWKGELAKIFGLGKFVDPDDRKNLWNGFSPDGEIKLVRSAGAENHQAGWHFLVIAPKSFSVYVASAPLAEQQIALEGYRVAVEAARKCLEEHAGQTRRGGERERVALLWAVWHHYQSQAQDPHIHTHLELYNFGMTQDGAFGALVSEDFFHALRLANAVFEVELAAQLRERLHLKIIPLDKRGFKIEGVPDELCATLSKRSVTIKNKMAKHGAQSPKAAAFAAHNTREAKDILSKEALFARSAKVARDHGFTEDEVKKLSRAEHAKTASKEEFQANFKAAHEKGKQEGWVRSQFIEAGRKLAIEHGAKGETVKEALREQLGIKPAFIRIEWQALFKKAPAVSPAKLVKTPRIVIGKPYRKWGNIRWQKDTSLGRVRVQDRIPFSQALDWNPLHKLRIPAIRFGKMRLTEKELWEKTHRKIKVPGGEFRLQERRLFPRALKWNPARKLKVVSPRFVPNENKVAKPKEQQRDHSH